MCTVTYIPSPGANFVLTSNRDEAAHRSPQSITSAHLHGQILVFPKDAGAGGTWIAASSDGRCACLLNGAFEKHQHRPPYSRSRGIMVLDYFSFVSAADFLKNYDFSGMEPFTFVLPGNDGLHEIRWDATKAHWKKLDASAPQIWSSATLYPPEIRTEREAWFREWLHERTDFSSQAIRHFHEHGGKKDSWNGFVMNRLGKVQTVSVTGVVKMAGRIEMTYHDLLREKTLIESIALTG